MYLVSFHRVFTLLSRVHGWRGRNAPTGELLLSSSSWWSPSRPSPPPSLRARFGAEALLAHLHPSQIHCLEQAKW